MRGIFIMIKESRHQGDVTTIHLYMPNNKVPKYMTQKLIELKREINKTDKQKNPSNNNKPWGKERI